LAFTAAYEAAEAFSRLYAARRPGAGFLRTILLRRIGSSARAGLETARHLLGRIDAAVIPEDEIGDEGVPADYTPPDPEEIQLLRDVERNLAAVVDGTDIDPKVQVVLHYLRERRWLDLNGAIIFSQYRTTAEWVLEALCAAFSDEPVALYAGGSASFVQRGSDRRTAAREQIKTSIQNGDIRLVCATDAACEGLNLQRLGAQVNIDLPWNPSRLEQRKGRVQRIGQVRDDVHILNLRYAGDGRGRCVRGSVPSLWRHLLRSRPAPRRLRRSVDRRRSAGSPGCQELLSACRESPASHGATVHARRDRRSGARLGIHGTGSVVARPR
jgi:hypothetical protein